MKRLFIEIIEISYYLFIALQIYLLPLNDIGRVHLYLFSQYFSSFERFGYYIFLFCLRSRLFLFWRCNLCLKTMRWLKFQWWKSPLWKLETAQSFYSGRIVKNSEGNECSIFGMYDLNTCLCQKFTLLIFFMIVDMNDLSPVCFGYGLFTSQFWYEEYLWYLSSH